MRTVHLTRASVIAVVLIAAGCADEVSYAGFPANYIIEENTCRVGPGWPPGFRVAIVSTPEDRYGCDEIHLNTLYEGDPEWRFSDVGIGCLWSEEQASEADLHSFIANGDIDDDGYWFDCQGDLRPDGISLTCQPELRKGSWDFEPVGPICTVELRRGSWDGSVD